MADFRIDVLELNLTASGKYTMLAIANADQKDNNIIDATVNGREIIFDPGAITEDKRVFFRSANLDFNSYDTQVGGNKGDEILNIFILDHDTTPANKKKKGGIVIANTKYPPPNSFIPYDYFTRRFVIKRMFVQRIDDTDEFTIDVTFDYNSTINDYISDNFEFKSDTRDGKTTDILIFRVFERTPAPVSVPFSCKGGSVGAKKMNLKTYPIGLPFFVVKYGDDFAAVDYKIGMVSIM